MLEHTTPLTQCLCCNNSELFTALNLYNQPLANSYLNAKDEIEPVFPLALNYCPACTHLQLTHAVDPDLLFKHYLYVSGTTQTLRDYFDEFVDLVESETSTKPLNVLDIACNDGSQLDSFKKKSHNTYGIDPAENLHKQSSANHNVVCDYLNSESIGAFGVEFDAIIAQNVFAHNTYPLEFLLLCKSKLKDGGKIFIQTSQADMVRLGQFDTVYHEHISFFSIKSMVALLGRAGLYLKKVIKPAIHGTSYLFIISADSSEDQSTHWILSEPEVSKRTARLFAINAHAATQKLLNDLHQARQTHAIVGYGAAAKGNTVLNYGNIKLDYIVDDNPLKQHKFSPGMRIEILSLPDVLSRVGDKPIAWVPLSWNFFKEIKQRIKQARDNPNDTFVQLDFSTT